MLFELFVVGTLWFWGLLAVELAILAFSAVWEKGFLFLGSVIVTALALQLFGNVPIFVWMWDHWLLSLGLVGIYLVGGCAYIFPKWWLFVTDHLRRYKELRDSFLESKSIKGNVIPEELYKEWQDYFSCARGYGGDGVEYKPAPRKHKERIMAWMIGWPINMPYTLLNDPVRRFFRHVYYQVADSLQKITDKVFRDVEKEMETPPK